ncbi:hypothetical protein ACHQM5_026652 [Ranunculus cassubicifolius]
MATTVNLVSPISFTHRTPIRTRLTSTPKEFKVRAKFGLDKGDDDPFLQSAINRASIRFQETTLNPKPLFHDPYAACFVDSDDLNTDIKQIDSSHYCLATKFIDDKVISEASRMEGVKQIVLLTDGMDTRQYRLKWPNSSVIFGVSPEEIYKSAAQKLQGVGAKIPRSCFFAHIPLASSNMQEILCRKGFNGNRPSIWVLQGLPLLTLESFVDIVALVSSLAAKGCFFIGELPAWLIETDILIKPDARRWMDKIFMSNGFRVKVISYDEIAMDMGKSTPLGDCKHLLFVAEQLRLSDIQMETWRREYQRIEEEGDEDGFEEL